MIQELVHCFKVEVFAACLAHCELSCWVFYFLVSQLLGLAASLELFRWGFTLPEQATSLPLLSGQSVQLVGPGNDDLIHRSMERTWKKWILPLFPMNRTITFHWKSSFIQLSKQPPLELWNGPQVRRSSSLSMQAVYSIRLFLQRDICSKAVQISIGSCCIESLEVLRSAGAALPAYLITFA